MRHYNDYQLTKSDIRALRSADTICLDWYEGTGYIRAIKSKEHASDGFEQTVQVPVNTTIKVYGNRHNDNAEDVVRCYEMIHSPRYERFWVTVVDLLRTGDTLTLEWTEIGPDNGETYIGGAVTTTKSRIANFDPLYWDRVDLRVTRELKSRRKVMAFRLGNGHTPDNSAKMIRRGRW